MEEVENKMTIVTEKTIKVVPSAGISKLSELEIDANPDLALSLAEGGVNELNTPLRIGALVQSKYIPSGVVITVPDGKHYFIVTAHNMDFSGGGTFESEGNGEATGFDLG